MNSFLSVSCAVSAEEIATGFLRALLPMTVVLTVGLVTDRLARRWGAAVQSVTYRFTLLMVLTAPVMTSLAPRLAVSEVGTWQSSGAQLYGRKCRL